jgi:hypothetical protein
MLAALNFGTGSMSYFKQIKAELMFVCMRVCCVAVVAAWPVDPWTDHDRC